MAFTIFAGAAMLNPRRLALAVGRLRRGRPRHGAAVDLEDFAGLADPRGGGGRLRLVRPTRAGVRRGRDWAAVLGALLLAGFLLFASDVFLEILGKDATLTGHADLGRGPAAGRLRGRGPAMATPRSGTTSPAGARSPGSPRRPASSPVTPTTPGSSGWASDTPASSRGACSTCKPWGRRSRRCSAGRAPAGPAVPGHLFAADPDRERGGDLQRHPLVDLRRPGRQAGVAGAGIGLANRPAFAAIRAPAARPRCRSPGRAGTLPARTARRTAAAESRPAQGCGRWPGRSHCPRPRRRTDSPGEVPARMQADRDPQPARQGVEGAQHDPGFHRDA